MLNKKLRIRKPREFKLVYSRGKNISGKYVNLKFFKFEKKVQNQNFNHPKIGIVVSKKISNKATIRNKIKRQISAVLNDLIKNKPDNLHIIINVKKTPEKYDDLSNDIRECFMKISY